MEFTIYHNHQWSKSRKSLELLRSHKIEPTIIEYLKAPLSLEELKSIQNKLGMPINDFLRKNDAKYKELGLDTFNGSDDKLIQIIINNPRILERPIIISGDNAVIGRPPENILNLFQK